jgi:uncharacterized membrane protein SirB2
MVGFAEWLQATSISTTFQSLGWLIPLLQSIHIVCIGIVFISSLMICLRVLGRMRADEPFAAVWKRFAPWMWSGLAVMLITGALLIVGEPVREFTAISFWLKMTLLAIVVAMTAILGRVLRPAAPAVGTPFPAGAKTTAVAILVLWVGVIFLGRAIAYDVEVWGSLSQHGET